MRGTLGGEIPAAPLATLAARAHQMVTVQLSLDFGRPPSRREALLLGLSTYVGKTCPRQHDSERMTKTGYCVACSRESVRRWQANNPEKTRLNNANQDKKKFARGRRKTEDQKRKAVEYSKRYYIENSEKVKQYRQKYNKNNPARHAAEVALRKAIKRRATPCWADRKAIGLIYAECATMTKEAGTLYHVDHIVPLRGKTVCGLHVESNLRIITSAENESKGNRLIQELL